LHHPENKPAGHRSDVQPVRFFALFRLFTWLPGLPVLPVLPVLPERAPERRRERGPGPFSLPASSLRPFCILQLQMIMPRRKTVKK
jgi:hypothetical protein